ncbi:uncharacterized protein LOC118192019 [Stegodyphus dumicola]|uniref:uncharacterized protein LOC118192019 n=1 Tax=Stegodyphus dumicola TaxID=202533 RepID=UPI0015B1B6C5|nr:uncharacterized protein LOC118192019 [Stegodyphus dumicola]
MRLMQGHSWGLNPHIHKIIYQTVAEKIVTYAAAVWAQPMQSRKVRHLSSIQRQFMLNITRAYRTTATSALNILAGLVPLHISAEREAVLQQVKQLRQPATLYEETYWPRDYEIPANPLEFHPAQQSVGVRINLKGRPEDMNRYNTRIFTDGSKMDDNVGCAYVMFQGQEQVAQWKGHLNKNNSVFQGEALAIQKAVQHIAYHNIRNAAIVSDSMSALQAIQNPAHTSTIIKEIQYHLRQTEHLHVRLAWTKAHAGNTCNEAADLPRERRSPQHKKQEELEIPWPHSTLKRHLHLQALAKVAGRMGHCTNRQAYTLPSNVRKPCPAMF